MRHVSYQELSRSNWGPAEPRGYVPSMDDLKTGSILRIADALEKIAVSLDPAEREKRDNERAERAGFRERINRQKEVANWVDSQSVPVPRGIGAYSIGEAFVKFHGVGADFRDAGLWRKTGFGIISRFGPKRTALAKEWVRSVFPEGDQ